MNPRRLPRWTTANSILALGASAALLFLGAAAGMAKPPRAVDDEKSVTGRIERLTTAPKGETDGAALDDGTLLHWPPHLGQRASALVARGDRVRAEGRTETGPAGDTHFEVSRLTNLRSGESMDLGAAPPPRDDRGPRRDRERGEQRTVEGRVSSVTTAPRGEVDGVTLEDGTVIHWPPHLEGQFADLAVKGERIRVVGRMETTPRGDTHLEVQTLTNLRSGETRNNEDDGPKASKAPRGAKSRAADPDARMRALEQRVDRLEDQNERLQRDRN